MLDLRLKYLGRYVTVVSVRGMGDLSNLPRLKLYHVTSFVRLGPFSSRFPPDRLSACPPSLISDVILRLYFNFLFHPVQSFFKVEVNVN